MPMNGLFHRIALILQIKTDNFTGYSEKLQALALNDDFVI